MGAFSDTIVDLGHGLVKRAAREQVWQAALSSCDTEVLTASQCYREASSLEKTPPILIRRILSGYGLFSLVSFIRPVLSLSLAEHNNAVVIIIFMTQILATILGKIKQPRVIAEVIGGILLGPTVMGRIPSA